MKKTLTALLGIIGLLGCSSETLLTRAYHPQRNDRIQSNDKIQCNDRNYCDRMEFSETKIRCYREYVVDEEDTIVDAGDCGYGLGDIDYDDDYEVVDRLIWEITPEKCWRAYHVPCGETIIVEFSNGKIGEYEYTAARSAKMSATELSDFCKGDPPNLE